MSNPNALPRYEPVSQEDAVRYSIHDADYKRIVHALDRFPNQLECGVLSYLWSDEISARSGYTFLRSVYRKTPTVIASRGTSWGVLDIDFDEAIAVCTRSGYRYATNDPKESGSSLFCSAFEEYSSFAGIRPEGATLSIHVGDSENSRSQLFLQRLIEGTIRAANTCGVPIIARELIALPGHDLFPTFSITMTGSLTATQLPSPIKTNVALTGAETLLYIGKPTAVPGKGRTPLVFSPPASPAHSLLLSQMISDFLSKDLLLEIQPINNGGLLFALVQLASRLSSGMNVDYESIPFAQALPLPEVGLTVHSPHRVLAVVQPDSIRTLSEELVRAGFTAVSIGRLNRDKNLEVEGQHRSLISVPIGLLALDQGEQNYELLAYPPMLHRSASGAQETEESRTRTSGLLSGSTNKAPWEDTWLDFLADTTISSRQRLTREADQFVGGSAIIDGSQLTGALRIASNSSFIGNRPYRAIVAVTRTSPIIAIVDPYLGAAHAGADALRTLAACGAQPVAATQALVFGDPAQYKRLSEFAEAVRGLSDACKIWKIPVIAESTDFQPTNQVPSVPPTLVVTLLGIQPDIRTRVPTSFRDKGDIIFLLGDTRHDLAASEYRRYMHGEISSPTPDINFQEEALIATLLPELASQKLVSSASSVSVGGLAVAIPAAGISRSRPIGARLEVPDCPIEVALFSETAARALISFPAANEQKITEICNGFGVPIRGRGVVGGKEFVVVAEGQTVEIPISTANQIWSRALDHML